MKILLLLDLVHHNHNCERGVIDTLSIIKPRTSLLSCGVLRYHTQGSYVSVMAVLTTTFGVKEMPLHNSWNRVLAIYLFITFNFTCRQQTQQRLCPSLEERKLKRRSLESGELIVKVRFVLFDVACLTRWLRRICREVPIPNTRIVCNLAQNTWY
jgi:hypothetical protein